MPVSRKKKVKKAKVKAATRKKPPKTAKKKKVVKKTAAGKKTVKKTAKKKSAAGKSAAKKTVKVKTAKKKIAKMRIVKKKIVKKKPAKKKAVKKVIKKKVTKKKIVKKKVIKKKPVKKKKVVEKKTAGENPLKKKTPKKKSTIGAKRIAAPKRKKAGSGSLKKRSATIGRPIPRIKGRATRKVFTASDIARMTKPGDIENILSQISDSTKEIQAVEATKFDIGIKHNGMALAEQELPGEYGVDRAVVLVVDPTFVFTYWEVKNDSLKEAAKRVGQDGKLTLRFYDVGTSNTPEQSHFWDVEVFDRLGNWYLRLAHPEQNICLDIGLKNAQGHFYRITRSNLVRLPQQSLAKPGPIKWMVVTPSGEKSVSDVEDYTDADLTLLKRIMGPYFFDLLMRGRLASITGSSVEAIFYDVAQLKEGASPSGTVPWTTP